MTPLSWSNTRITVLEYCQKKYFFSYYSDSLKQKYPELWKIAKINRKLKSLEMWMGEMTHKIISLYLFQLKNHITQEGPIPNITELITKNSQEMKKIFIESKKNNYTDFIDFGLSEHFYKEIDDDKLNIVIQKIIGNLESFINSDYHKRIEQRFRKGHHIYIEDPQHTNFEIMKVDISQIQGLEGISVLASPDFGIMFGDNQYIILDWKSGKENLESSEITDQLRTYALKVILKNKTTKIDNFNIDVHEVYLPSLHFKSGIIKQQDIDMIIDKIQEDIKYQKQFIVDQDQFKNIALPHTNFSRTSSDKKCINCTFREVCKQLKAKENI